MSITIKIKQGENNFDIQTNKENKVAQLKQQIADKKGISTINGMKLIFKGKILKDEDVLNSLSGLENNSVMHVVLPKTDSQPAQTSTTQQPSSSSTQQPQQQQPNLGGLGGLGGMGGLGGTGGMGGMPGMEGMNMQDIINNPQFSQMANSLLSNPQMMQQMMQNPMFQQMMQGNPMMQQLMQNPEQMQAMMQNPMVQQMLNNPQQLQQMMQLGGAGGLGGFGGFGGQPGQSGQSGSGQQQMPNYAQMMQQLGGMGGMGMPAQQVTNPQETFKDQLVQLKNMGFTNESVNIEVLKQTYGNVEAAVEKLINMMN